MNIRDAYLAGEYLAGAMLTPDFNSWDEQAFYYWGLCNRRSKLEARMSQIPDVAIYMIAQGFHGLTKLRQQKLAEIVDSWLPKTLFGKALRDYSLGSIKLQLGKWDESLEHFTASKLLFENSDRYFHDLSQYSLFNVLLQREQYAHVRPRIEQAVSSTELHPRIREYMINILAELYWKTGDLNLLWKLYRQHRISRVKSYLLLALVQAGRWRAPQNALSQDGALSSLIKELLLFHGKTKMGRAPCAKDHVHPLFPLAKAVHLLNVYVKSYSPKDFLQLAEMMEELQGRGASYELRFLKSLGKTLFEQSSVQPETHPRRVEISVRDSNYGFVALDGSWISSQNIFQILVRELVKNSGILRTEAFLEIVLGNRYSFEQRASVLTRLYQIKKYLNDKKILFEVSKDRIELKSEFTITNTTQVHCRLQEMKISDLESRLQMEHRLSLTRKDAQRLLRVLKFFEVIEQTTQGANATYQRI